MSALVCLSGGQPTTNSLVIAEKFKKRHGDVIRAIRNVECSEEFSRRNFAPRDYLDERGKPQPCYTITRDGFAFLCMGFTGQEAAAWKERFIGAFIAQAREIDRLRQMHAAPDWRQARLEGKTARRAETDVIKAFVAYASSQGSRSASRYFLAITKETNRALFYVSSAVGKGFREHLSASQLATVAMAERIVERSLRESMARRMFYKDAYRAAADRVRQFAALIGQSVPLLTEGAQ